MNGILTDSDGDIKIANGTLAIGDCTADVAERVLQAYPGEFKEVPELGLFAVQQLNGNGNPFWSGEARKQLKSQGISATVSIENEQITIAIKE